MFSSDDKIVHFLDIHRFFFVYLLHKINPQVVDRSILFPFEGKFPRKFLPFLQTEEEKKRLSSRKETRKIFLPVFPMIDGLKLIWTEKHSEKNKAQQNKRN